jgi:hypothetical protein
MYTPEDITTCFDGETLKYLQNKHRGGTNGQKGTRYEDYFAIYQLALLAPKTLEEGQEIHLLSQVLSFVDDLIVDNLAEPLHHYQLKSGASVSWTSGSPSIVQDFERQYRLNQQQKARESFLYLIVADSVLSAKLKAATPANIQAFTQVQHFPHNPNLSKAIQQNPAFQLALVYLSAFENPGLDKLEWIASVLMAAWVTESTQPVSVMTLLTKAQQVSPCYIRSFKPGIQLDVELVKVLACIDNFTYNLSKGFFHWEYLGGLQQGTLPFSIETQEFQRFQERIKKQKPTTFEALEILL